MINKLNNHSTKDVFEINENINKHSDNITNSKFHHSFSSPLINLMNNMNNQKITNDLYYKPFSRDEITKAVKSLKNGKSTSNDLIINAMIKYGI